MPDNEEDYDPDMTLCDMCGDEVEVDDTQGGHSGTEWRSCTLCNDCYSETEPD